MEEGPSHLVGGQEVDSMQQAMDSQFLLQFRAHSNAVYRCDPIKALTISLSVSRQNWTVGNHSFSHIVYFKFLPVKQRNR